MKNLGEFYLVLICFGYNPDFFIKLLPGKVAQSGRISFVCKCLWDRPSHKGHILTFLLFLSQKNIGTKYW